MKNHNHSLLKSFIKSIIQESTSLNNIACYHWYDDSSESSGGAILYNTLPLLQIKSYSDYDNTLINLQNIILAGVKAGRPRTHGPCNFSWEITKIFGQGYSDLLYSIIFDISPTQSIIPDRNFVSPAARSKIYSAFHDPSIKKIPLDDIDSHSPPKPHDNHTDDTSDDCTLYMGPENTSNNPKLDNSILNYSYESPDNNSQTLDTLYNNHKSITQHLKSTIFISPTQWEHHLKNPHLISSLFSSHYKSHPKNKPTE